MAGSTDDKFDYVANDRGSYTACCCIGPQNGQPLCPCRMRNVTIENGRYVEKRDLGPAVKPYNPLDIIGPGLVPEPYDPVPLERAKTELERCLHEGIEAGTIAGISCPCPKCSPRC